LSIVRGWRGTIIARTIAVGICGRMWIGPIPVVRGVRIVVRVVRIIASRE